MAIEYRNIVDLSTGETRIEEIEYPDPDPALVMSEAKEELRAVIYADSDTKVDALNLLPGGKHGSMMASSIGFILAEVKGAGDIALISESSQARIASESAVRGIEPLAMVQIWAAKHAEMVLASAPILARRAELLLLLDNAESPEDLEAIRAELD